jgi:hypothetical protein
MSIKSRLAKLEKMAPPPPDERDTDERAKWESFYKWLSRELDSHPEAHRRLRETVAGNSWIWKSGGCREGKTLSLSRTCWEALKNFPDAMEAAERAFERLDSEQRAAWAAWKPPPPVLFDGVWDQEAQCYVLDRPKPSTEGQTEWGQAWQLGDEAEPFSLE